MVMRVFGLAAGRRVERRWTLIADKGDGPEIPTLAAAILAERVLAGACRPGARDAGDVLSLADCEPEFTRLAIGGRLARSFSSIRLIDGLWVQSSTGLLPQFAACTACCATEARPAMRK
jgi:hypothetical protein